MAPLVAYTVINVVGLSLLMIIFFNSRKVLNVATPDNMLLLLAAIFTAAILVFDWGMWMIDKRAFVGAREMNIIITFIYFVLNPIPCMLWSMYVDYNIFEDVGRIKKHFKIFLIPIVINFICCVISIFTNCIFFISENNVYLRGDYLEIMLICSYGFFVYSFGELLINRKKIDKKRFLNLTLFVIPLVICSIIQVCFYGLNIIWIGVSIALLVVYVNVQSDAYTTDYLTGLFNRRYLEKYLTVYFKSDEKIELVGIMLDIDKFKAINDKYGHNEGDAALKTAAAILTKDIKKKDFVARYAGDEFVVLCQITEGRTPEAIVETIRRNSENYNETSGLPYSITFSLGYSIIDKKKSVQEFLNEIDLKMYENKKKVL